MRIVPKHQISSPLHIKFSGWKQIVLSVKDEIGRDNTAIVAAGVAFYAFLAIFPAIMALISIYGLATNPEQIESQISNLASMMPEQAYEILKGRMENLMETSNSSLSWGTAFGILFSIWSANKGTKSLFIGVDLAYDTESSRGFLKQNALTLAFTLGSIILIILSMSLIVGFPAFIHKFGLPDQIEKIIGWTRWILLAVIAVFFLSVLYKSAPFRPASKTKWILPGAILATFLWLIASWGFSYYVSNFGSYGEMYGSISAVVVLMLWLLLTSLIILLGAEFNSEIEKYAENPEGEKEK